jgi:hypothetical protein
MILKCTGEFPIEVIISNNREYVKGFFRNNKEHKGRAAATGEMLQESLSCDRIFVIMT